MAVAKRRKSKIVVGQKTYYWSVDHIPGDENPTLVVMSPDKSLCFHYPLDEHTHGRFVHYLNRFELHPPIPSIRSTQTPDTRNPAFNITPLFVSTLIDWCLSNHCLTTPGRSGPSFGYPTAEEERTQAAWGEVAEILKQKGLPEFYRPKGVSPSNPWEIARFLRMPNDDIMA